MVHFPAIAMLVDPGVYPLLNVESCDNLPTVSWSSSAWDWHQVFPMTPGRRPQVIMKVSHVQTFHGIPLSGWWLNQPPWKTLVKLEIFPNFRGENRKYLKPPPRYSDFFIRDLYSGNIYIIYNPPKKKLGSSSSSPKKQQIIWVWSLLRYFMLPQCATW